jgi:hypothetical protein
MNAELKRAIELVAYETDGQDAHNIAIAIEVRLGPLSDIAAQTRSQCLLANVDRDARWDAALKKAVQP